MAKSFKKERFKLKTDILTGSSTLDDWKSLYLLNDDGAIVDGSQEDITFKDPEEIIDEYIKAVDMDRSVPEMERSISDVQSSQTSQFEITEEKAKLVPFQRHYTDILKSDPGGPRSKIMEAQKYADPLSSEDEDEAGGASGRPPVLKTQVSDDGLKCLVSPNGGAHSSSAENSKSVAPHLLSTRPKAPTPPPGTMVEGRLLEHADVIQVARQDPEERMSCMLVDAGSMKEPGPQLYEPNDGTYITCTETMEYANVPYFPGNQERLKSRKHKYRTSSDTLKLQRLIDYLKTTGSDAGTKLEANASEYLNRVNQLEDRSCLQVTIPHYTGNENDWSSGGED